MLSRLLFAPPLLWMHVRMNSKNSSIILKGTGIKGLRNLIPFYFTFSGRCYSLFPFFLYIKERKREKRAGKNIWPTFESLQNADWTAAIFFVLPALFKPRYQTMYVLFFILPSDLSDLNPRKCDPNSISMDERE